MQTAVFPVQRISDFFLTEITYHPNQVKGLSLTASYAQDWGKLTGKNKGGMMTVSYRGIFNPKKQRNHE